MTTGSSWPPRIVIRKSSGLRTLESALIRSGLGPVAGVDEAGRGACAGPLVVAACLLAPKAQASLADLDDSKKLTERAREQLFPVIKRLALGYHVVCIPAWEIDAIGIHVANIEGMRRAVAGLGQVPGYVLTDGFRVPGLPVPSLPVIGGDATAACIAAASILAKVTRDRMLVDLDARLPGYGFAAHKGYNTPVHTGGAGPAGRDAGAPALVAQRAAVGCGRDVMPGWIRKSINPPSLRSPQTRWRSTLCVRDDCCRFRAPGRARKRRDETPGRAKRRDETGRTRPSMSAEDIENYETEMELSLYREYKDIVGQFSYVVETERRFYLANSVELLPRNADGEVYFEVRMADAWVWDMYRPARFVKHVRVITFKDVNIEELDKPELRLPD